MDDMLALDQDQLRIVNAAFKGLLHPTSTESVESLLRRWEAFAAEVESGYELTIYDYENSLGTRCILRDVAGSVPHDLSERISLALRPVDSRFEAATEAFPRGLLPASHLPEEEWWYFRKPVVLKGELADDWERD